MSLLTCFKMLRRSYVNHRSTTLEPSSLTAFHMTEAAQKYANDRDGAIAWSFGRFNEGQMNGESYKGSTAINLEYMMGKDLEARWAEVAKAAENVGGDYTIGNTMTRYGQPTITVIFWLNAEVEAARYSRLASVMATRMGVYNAAPGVQAHTHLFHVHPQTEFVHYPSGGTIAPDYYIKITENEAQNFDPFQFERDKPPAKAQPNQSPWPELFEGL